MKGWNMRAHTNEDAQELAEILTENKQVECEVHGVIPNNLVGAYYWPSYGCCPICVSEFFVEKFPITLRSKRNDGSIT